MEHLGLMEETWQLGMADDRILMIAGLVAPF
jgi:hypothetical protein